MRSSILSRSVIAAASLAIGSAALTAAPATAATPSGVTRDMVLTAASGARAPSAESWATTTKALRGIVNRSCNVDHDADDYVWINDAGATATGGHAEGVLIDAGVGRYTPDSGWSYERCIVGAVTTSDPAFVLKGTAKLGVTTRTYEDEVGPAPAVPTSYTLSGDVSVATTTVALPDDSYIDETTFTATGNATRTTKTTTSTTVSKPKTAKQKKAAKQAYGKKLKAAKKAYDKALKKAGSSTSKKTAAKKAYNKKKASAKASYKKATATVRTVKKTTTAKTENRPFTISASSDDYVPFD